MKPDDTRQQTPIVVPTRTTSLQVDSRLAGTQDASANIARTQIASAYGNTTTPEPTPEVEPEKAPSQQYHGAVPYEPTSPYERTRDETTPVIEQNTWQKYHSAWQGYYQQYYERYYMSEVDKTRRTLEADAAAHQEQVAKEPEVFTKDEALYDLRSRLLEKVRTQATSVRKSRHFIPIAAALGVMLIFVGLQYNRTLIANVSAYIAPGNTDPEYLDARPGGDAVTSEIDMIHIPKVNIKIPIVWNAIASDQNSLNRAMDNGAAWFNVQGASAKPGEKGNSVYSAHSSNDWTDSGDYKFAFAPLVRVKEGDMIYIDYQKKRYTYTITHMKEVKPTDVNALREGADKPYITLITCVPLGTALNRLLVFADQVSPSPTTAAEQTAEEEQASTESSAMPRNSPTFFERIFGGN